MAHSFDRSGIFKLPCLFEGKFSMFLRYLHVFETAPHGNHAFAVGPPEANILLLPHVELWDRLRVQVVARLAYGFDLAQLLCILINVVISLQIVHLHRRAKVGFSSRALECLALQCVRVVIHSLIYERLWMQLRVHLDVVAQLSHGHLLGLSRRHSARAAESFL